MEKLYDGFLKIFKIETPLGSREVCVRPDAVACLIYDDTHVLLTEQDRPGALWNNNKRPFYEVPAGMVDNAEFPLNAMRREIKEEIGIDIDKNLLYLHGLFYPSPGGLSERIFLYSYKVKDVQSLEIVAQSDSQEQIQVHILERKNVYTQDMKTAYLLELTKS